MADTVSGPEGTGAGARPAERSPARQRDPRHYGLRGQRFHGHGHGHALHARHELRQTRCDDRGHSRDVPDLRGTVQGRGQLQRRHQDRAVGRSEGAGCRLCGPFGRSEGAGCRLCGPLEGQRVQGVGVSEGAGCRLCGPVGRSEGAGCRLCWPLEGQRVQGVGVSEGAGCRLCQPLEGQRVRGVVRGCGVSVVWAVGRSEGAGCWLSD